MNDQSGPPGRNPMDALFPQVSENPAPADAGSPREAAEAAGERFRADQLQKAVHGRASAREMRAEQTRAMPGFASPEQIRRRVGDMVYALFEPWLVDVDVRNAELAAEVNELRREVAAKARDVMHARELADEAAAQYHEQADLVIELREQLRAAHVQLAQCEAQTPRRWRLW